MINRQSNQAGFSLIETIVAIFIVALISAGAGVMLTQTAQAGKQVSERSDMLSELQIANALLRDDFGSLAIRSTASPSAFETSQVFEGLSADTDKQFLTFARHGWSLAPSGEKRGDLQRVSYRFEDGQLIRTAWLRPDPDSETPTVERVLLKGISDFQINYGKDGLWESEWRARTESAEDFIMPDAFELICEFENGTVLRQVFLAGART